MANVSHLLLAAGSSKRMGQPKQLLPWGDKTLIEHQVQIRLHTNKDVTVVLGSYADKVLPLIEKLPVKVYINNKWAKGMGNSLSFGLKMMSKSNPDLDGVLISLLDQPLVTIEHFQKIVSLYLPKKKQIIVSQSESGWSGVPALFDKFYFKELTELNGDEGAKKIIQKYRNISESITCYNLLEDIDTPQAYHRLLKKHLDKTSNNTPPE